MTNPTIGKIIAALTAAATLGIMGVSYGQWHSAQPGTWVRQPGLEVGVRYDERAAQPWAGLEETLGVAQVVIARHYPAHVADVLHFWLDVVEPGGVVRGSSVPDGTIEDKQVTGTLDFEAYFWGVVKRRVVRVRQAPPRQGAVPPAGLEDAMLHEIAEHLLPWHVEGKNLNAGHDPRWSAIRAEMERELADRRTKTSTRTP